MIFINETEFKDKVGIYLIRNKVNNKVYIGQTNEKFIKRFWNHKWKLNHNSHDNKYLQNAWNKYGEDSFEFEAIYVLQPDDNIDDLERKFIAEYKEKVGTYNIQAGGQDHTCLNIPLSEETKAKIGAKNKINSTGKKASEETKRKMSEIRMGKTNWGICKITAAEAEQIKKLILKGESLPNISKITNVEYKVINGIYSTNTYKSVHVEGWDEFFQNRKRERLKKLRPEDIEQIKIKREQGYDMKVLAEEYGVDRNTIKYHLNK